MCPANAGLTSLDGQSMPFTYTMPTLGGTSVEKSACSPPAGSLFPAGQTTTVTCEATAAQDLAAACSFDVSVVIPPRLSKTTFRAFGDSITEGVFRTLQSTAVASALGGDGDRFWITVPAQSYPTQLFLLLTERYPFQTFSVANRGIGGEQTTLGLHRLARELSGSLPEVLVLLEGVNDLMALINADRGARVDVGPTANNLAAMLDFAQSRGVDVLIATLTPVSDERNRHWPNLQLAIDDLNARIRSIAAARGVTVVDLFSALKDPSLLQNDGLHPTAEGYRRIAEVVLQALAALYEFAPAPQPSSGLAVPPSN